MVLPAHGFQRVELQGLGRRQPVFGGRDPIGRRMAQTPQQGGGLLRALQDDLDQVRGHLARQGEHFIGVLFQGFGDQDDFLFAWRREVSQFHLGKEFGLEIDALGQFPEGIALLHAELPDNGAQGFVHGVTYYVDTSPL
jgi:hypothetical protein